MKLSYLVFLGYQKQVKEDALRLNIARDDIKQSDVLIVVFRILMESLSNIFFTLPKRPEVDNAFFIYNAVLFS